ncbi:MAG: hypothetical protein ABGX27_08795 [Desulfurobacteriaceae bacterium]
MKLTTKKLKKIFDKCFSEIGREKNKDVQWYLKKRPKRITKQSFFEQAVWAIWVAGKTRRSAETFLSRAEEKGFVWDFTTIASWNKARLTKFMEKLHGRPVPKGARKRWEAIYQIAKLLNNYSNEAEFRKEFFNGKIKSAELDKNDVKNLVKLGLPFIRKANASFILRNMGGEFIKHDRWVEAFLRHYNLSLDDLEKMLQTLNIPLGLFDIVIWAYCEKFIGDTKKLNEHFKQAFG